MTVIGEENVQKYKRNDRAVKDKNAPSETRRIYTGRLISTEHMTDLIESAKLDYRFGWIF